MVLRIHIVVYRKSSELISTWYIAISTGFALQLASSKHACLSTAAIKSLKLTPELCCNIKQRRKEEIEATVF